ncbi:MAG: cytidylate kinase-like family protein [Lachnospiraceae bacterium]|nr:cytidylate kinase-like family protein [Lachnospiraceae bacterium]MCR5684934.1 cytidylate kinase-like family protein [Lachnospiraceae bacterium]
MREKQIITIGRQLGSGGREIGKRLANELNLPYYDKELLIEAAKKSGYSEAVFEMHDEKPTNSFLYSLAMGMNSFGTSFQRPLVLDLYLAQFETMRKLADEGGGVFIGRCADHVFAERKDALHVFIHADMDFRAGRVMEWEKISREKAENICKRGDKDRAAYYNYYSDHEWGDSRYYDITVNTGKLGIDKAVELIKSCLDV